MKFPVGQQVLLLENMAFKGGGQSLPLATATVLEHTESGDYKIVYEVLASGEKGELTVPEERLLAA